MRHLPSVWLPFALLLMLAFSCGNCSDETGTPGVNSGSADSALPNNGGADVGGDTTGGGGSDTGDACGIHSSLCDDQCIPTSNDPLNCGGCGVVCDGDQVCSGGHCADSCVGGLTVCEGSCVDTVQDSNHCNGCGQACGDGMGCVNGACVDAVDIDFGAADCDGGGPVIDLGEVVIEERQCAARLAELTFRYGVCSCNDFDVNNSFYVDAYDSSLGPYLPGGFGGGIGANGGFEINDNATVTGTFWVAGPAGIDFSGRSMVGMRLLSGGPLHAKEVGTVGRDAFINGEMELDASYDVAGTLHLPLDIEPPGEVTYAGLNNADLTINEPCTECPPNNHIDVGAIVDAFADPANNDNALVGLNANLLNPAPNSPVRLDLPCGRYFLNGIDSNDAVTIVAHGNTALFIDGDVFANNALTITLEPDARLDVFISGNINTNNEFKLGSPAYPALLRVYVGGTTGFTTNYPVRIGGFLYVVPGSIDTNDSVEVFGGLYSNNVVTNNEWMIHFDRRIATIGDECDEPENPNNPPNNNPNNPPNNNPNNPNDPPVTSCATAGDDCTDDGECCSPLTCLNGSCQLLDCVPTYGSCTSSEQCCGTGVCTANTNGICVPQ